jgi:TrmH RNA methyltransferase
MHFEDYLSTWRTRESTSRLPIWVALDRVDNDHNRGAIARSLSWFGCEGLIWEGHHSQLSGAALRVAQGGAEDIELLAVPSLLDALEHLKANGVVILGADQHEGERSRSALTHPSQDVSRGVCWVMGSEQFGLSRPVKTLCDELVMIPGSGQMESLNVSVSAGILITQSYHWLSAD